MKVLNKIMDMAVLGYVGTAFYYQYNVAHPDVQGYGDVIESGLAEGYYDKPFLNSLNKELVVLRSEYGYDLYGYFIDNGSDKNVIFSHGVTSNIYGMLKYAKLYTDLGFNIFTYDHRNHGRSGGNNTTFGYYEKDDLETCVRWLKQRVGNDKVIGVHGESMGTAIAIQHQAQYNSVDFVVADCGFASMNRILSEVNDRESSVPIWIVRPLASLINKLMGSDFFYNISPLRCVKKIDKPIYFVHGEDDDYVYASHSRDMFAAKTNGYKKIYYAKNSPHARSIIYDRENYGIQLREFLEDINVI